MAFFLSCHIVWTWPLQKMHPNVWAPHQLFISPGSNICPQSVSVTTHSEYAPDLSRICPIWDTNLICEREAQRRHTYAPVRSAVTAGDPYWGGIDKACGKALFLLLIFSINHRPRPHTRLLTSVVLRRWPKLPFNHVCFYSNICRVRHKPGLRVDSCCQIQSLWLI